MFDFRDFRFPFANVPTAPVDLSDDERAVLDRLEQKAARERQRMLVSQAYYLGEQFVKNLRIAVPQELEFLQTVLGWPALAVDPYVERLAVDCFRLPGSTDADDRLMDLWHLNGLDAELPLAVTDALSLERCYWVVGSPVEAGGAPVITVESPMNMVVEWDLRGQSAVEALQKYWDKGRQHAAFHLQGRTITLAEDDQKKWVVVDRDEHGFAPPIVRMAHAPRTSARDGRSAITPAIRSITDSACRTLQNLEVARELFSVMKEVWLGAAEEAFKNSDGSSQSRYDAYMTRIKMIERDENGELPEIKQLQAYDPGVFTKLLDMYASQMASQVCAPPQDLGLYTQGNPVSADAVDAMEARRNRRARLHQRTFSAPLVQVMKLAVQFQNKGTLPPEFDRMSVDWTDVEEPSLGARGDFYNKMVAGGAGPGSSDVLLSKAGFSAIERERLAQDRDADPGRVDLAELATSLEAKQARTDLTVAKDTKGTGGNGGAVAG